MKLDGKVAILTGASSNMGEAIALSAARNGASVVLGYNINPKAKVLADNIRASGGRALLVRVDISKQEQVESMVKETIDKFGRADILVNVAAFKPKTWGKYFHETEVADWDQQIGTTLKGTLFCCKAVIPHMIKQGSGRIINITSVGVKVNQYKGLELYAGCKAAIAVVSRHLAAQLASHGILVNCIAPGLIGMPDSVGDSRYSDKLLRTIPLRRVGEPQDIANMVLLLASEEGKYITGQQYSIDGGGSMFF